MEEFQFNADLLSSLHEEGEEDLQVLAEDPANDDQIELYIYFCFLIFRKSHSTQRLEQAIQQAERWTTATAENHPDYDRRYSILNNLMVWGHQYQAVEESIEAVLTPLNINRQELAPNETDIHFCLNCELKRLASSFQQTDRLEYLNKFIKIMELAINIAGEYITPAMLNNFGSMLGSRFVRTGLMNDINQAISITREAVNAIPHDHPNQAMYLSNLGSWLDTRFRRTGLIADINEAVSVASNAVNATPQNHPQYASRLSNLGSLLGTQFERTGLINKLNQAINAASNAMDIIPHYHLDRAACLNNLGSLLTTRFESTGLINDLNRAVNVARDAVNATPYDHPDCAMYLYTLALTLGRRYERLGSINDLNMAVTITSHSLRATPHDHPDRPGRLNSLGCWLNARFEQTRSIDDLNQAISVAREAVNATPHGHPDQPMHLLNLGSWLGIRFRRTGSIDDLNQAISAASNAVDAIPYDNPDYAMCLDNLGSWLGSRFERIGLLDDLNGAIEVVNQAVDSTPDGFTYRINRLSNLGTWLGTRFDRTGSMKDLNQAINFVSEAVNATPHDCPDCAISLNTLGSLFIRRFDQTGSMDDLSRAFSATNEAVNATSRGHLNYAMHLNTLGNILSRRFDQLGLMDDLNKAVSVASDAVDTTPHDDQNYAMYLNSLGNWLGKRFKQEGSIDDLNRQLSSYMASWHCATARPGQRIQSAYAATSILILQQDWEQSYQLLQEAVTLLPTVSPRSLNRTDAQALLADFFGLASSAAAAALSAGKAPEDALRLLELGRGVIASLLMDMRGDITNLQQEYPDLAEKFNFLRDELDLPNHNAIPLTSTDKVSSWELQIKRRREADREFNEVIDTIRAKPGFSNFLQPPTAEELESVAEQGPIVILNISSFRCDAFLLQRGSIQVIKLPSLSQDEVRHRVTSLSTNSNLSPLLEWLWRAICFPVLDALDFKHAVTDDNWPHIWWIPTGLLTQLPLHAAGIYKQGSKETVLDRAVSSYALSIKALLHGRKHVLRNPRQPPLEDSALMVAMQETPGLGERGCLPFASDEVHMLRGLCPQLQLAPIMPSRHKEDILKHLPKCKLFHFAGHGQSDSNDPSQSCLLLEDWETNPLTVGEVRDSWLQDNPPFLAYLSACSTGANKAIKLADEGIHLISAFQLAGFRHVVGTLWEVSDKHCVDVAKILYKTMQEEGMTDIAVSRGLHRAIRALRSGDAEDMQARDAKLACPRPARQGVTDFFWVPYIHFGV